jgi:hypothetical protein
MQDAFYARAGGAQSAPYKAFLQDGRGLNQAVGAQACANLDFDWFADGVRS